MENETENIELNQVQKDFDDAIFLLGRKELENKQLTSLVGALQKRVIELIEENDELKDNVESK